MKKLIIPILFIFLTTNIFGQETFTFNDFANFVEKKTLADFDKEIRKRGYSFKKSDKYPDKSTGYIYEKKVEINGRTYIAQIEYDDYGDGKPAIFFATTANNQMTKITDYLSSKGCGSPEIDTPKAGTIEYKYTCTEYKLILTETNKKALDNKDITQQTVLIYKR